MRNSENCRQDKLDWFDGKHINEILFCQEFLKTHPMRCIGGTLFTVDGPVESEELVKRQIIDMIQSCVTTNLSKRSSALLESLKFKLILNRCRWNWTVSTVPTVFIFWTEILNQIKFFATIVWQSATIPLLQSRCVGCNFFQNFWRRTIFSLYRSIWVTA